MPGGEADTPGPAGVSASDRELVATLAAGDTAAPGEVPGEPDVTITVSALDLCRLAANRLDAADLDASVVGARELVAPLLVGATAFSAD
jgi:hypothetical protein